MTYNSAHATFSQPGVPIGMESTRLAVEKLRSATSIHQTRLLSGGPHSGPGDAARMAAVTITAMTTAARMTPRTTRGNGRNLTIRSTRRIATITVSTHMVGDRTSLARPK